MTAFRPFIQIASSGRALNAAEMQDAMGLLLKGEASDIEAAGFLMALRARGETVEEIVAAATVMRDMAVPVDAPDSAVDTCGTGGDGAGTYNISTAAALVAAGAGVPVAKHGNKAASSKSGSSDVLAALGVNLHAKPAQIARCIDEANVGFMFAPAHHAAVANVAPVRTALGVRTLFNLLGPLSNPARAKRQVMGVFDKSLVAPLANTLLKLGSTRAWVVHGSDGLDELTTTGESFVAEVKDGAVTTFTISPQDAGLPLAEAQALVGGAPDENGEAIRALLDGGAIRADLAAYRDIVVLNAAAAILVGGKAQTILEGAQLAVEAIDSGKAKAALNALVLLSNEELANEELANEELA